MQNVNNCMAAGDHIDVFSTASNAFTGESHPASLGSRKEFAGMALTPHGDLGHRHGRKYVDLHHPRSVLWL